MNPETNNIHALMKLVLCQWIVKLFLMLKVGVLLCEVDLCMNFYSISVI